MKLDQTFIIAHHDYIVARHIAVFLMANGYQLYGENYHIDQLVTSQFDPRASYAILSRRYYLSLVHSLYQTISSDLVIVKSSHLGDQNVPNVIVSVPFLNCEVLKAFG